MEAIKNHINKANDHQETIEVLLKQISNTTEILKPSADVFKRLKLETSNVVRSSLKQWQTSYEEAIDVDRPDRTSLLEIYEQMEIDPHISALIETLYSNIMANGFVVNDSEGTMDAEATQLFEKPWFSQFVAIALDSIMWGFSGVQFTGINDGVYAGSKSIRRYHIIPELAGIRYNQNQDTIDIEFDDRSIFRWTAFLYPQLPADQYKLGKFNKIAKSFILIREVTQFWAIFNELFGIPFRVMKTNIQDSTRMDNAITAMQSMTSAAYSIIHEDDDIEFHNGVAASNTSTFKDFLDFAYKLTSKALVGSTMVLEDGSSRSQGEVHERNTNAFTVSYGKLIEQFVNHLIIPKMIEIGMDITADHRFKFDDTIEIGTKELVDIVAVLTKAGYKVDADYIMEKTGIPLEQIETQEPDPNAPELDDDGNPIEPEPKDDDIEGEEATPPDVQNLKLFKKITSMYNYLTKTK